MWRALPAFALVLAAACGAVGGDGAAVELIVDAPPGASRVEVGVSGAESGQYSVDGLFTDATAARLLYQPRAVAGTLHFAVAAYDASGALAGRGAADVALAPRAARPVTILLE